MRGYMGACCFAVTEWAYVFPMIALSMATMSYHAYERGALTQAMCFIFIAISTSLLLVVGFHTLMAVAKGEHALHVALHAAATLGRLALP